jgi:hypothetical protein
MLKILRKTKMETRHTKIYNAGKVVLRRKFIATVAYIKKKKEVKRKREGWRYNSSGRVLA